VRTLVVSDLHGNWPALEAVAAVPHDAVVCLGDIVGYGPQPGECLRWLRASHASIVQGNHDRSVADGVPPRCRLDFGGSPPPPCTSPAASSATRRRPSSGPFRRSSI
jgi:predicted phosphodiesterase